MSKRKRKINIFKHYYIKFLVKYFGSYLCPYCGITYCAYMCHFCGAFRCDCEDYICCNAQKLALEIDEMKKIERAKKDKD